MFHNALWHAKIYFEAFPDVKIINITRHPVDIIFSWYKKGYGSNYYSKKVNTITLIKKNNKEFPYYANGWEEEYDGLSNINRIIKMIYVISNNHFFLY